MHCSDESEPPNSNVLRYNSKLEMESKLSMAHKVKVNMIFCGFFFRLSPKISYGLVMCTLGDLMLMSSGWQHSSGSSFYHLPPVLSSCIVSFQPVSVLYCWCLLITWILLPALFHKPLNTVLFSQLKGRHDLHSGVALRFLR